MKAITYSKAKKTCWEWFSKYIRLRDCIKTTGTKTHAKCFTCEHTFPFKKLQAGHFIAGRHNGILFDERGCHAQCQMCNVWLAGNTVKYFRKMQQVYGEEVIKELEILDKIERQYKTYELLSMAEDYKRRFEDLQKS